MMNTCMFCEKNPGKQLTDNPFRFTIPVIREKLREIINVKLGRTLKNSEIYYCQRCAVLYMKCKRQNCGCETQVNPKRYFQRKLDKSPEFNEKENGFFCVGAKQASAMVITSKMYEQLLQENKKLKQKVRSLTLYLSKDRSLYDRSNQLLMQLNIFKVRCEAFRIHYKMTYDGLKAQNELLHSAKFFPVSRIYVSRSTLFRYKHHFRETIFKKMFTTNIVDKNIASVIIKDPETLIKLLCIRNGLLNNPGFIGSNFD